MQCDALCLYQVCEAGSNGSWCGRVRESCSALGWSLAIPVGVASHGTKAATNKKGPGFSLSPSLSLSLSVSLSPLHLKSHPQTVNGLRKRSWRWWEHDKPWTTSLWVWLSLCAMNWPPPNQQVNMQKCFISYSFCFYFKWQPWCFATWHALVAAGLRFLVYSWGLFIFKMCNTPVAQDIRLISGRLELIKHNL